MGRTLLDQAMVTGVTVVAESAGFAEAAEVAEVVGVAELGLELEPDSSRLSSSCL